MIYPTQRMVLLAAAVAPVALVLALAMPEAWTAGLGLLFMLLTLAALDALTGPTPRQLQLLCDGAQIVNVGETFEVDIQARGNSAPRGAEIALDVEGPLALVGRMRRPLQPTAGLPVSGAKIALSAERRGSGRIAGLWLRLPGLLGLVWKQRRVEFDRPILVTPDIRPTRDEGVQLATREMMHGQIARQHIGEGQEFESLADYRQGMDRRWIDWKQSGRHTRLIAKEYRVERNNNIVVAIDSGRSMCEPMEGVPRVDSAVAAALLTAFVALKQGDRIGLFAFDSKPRASSKVVSGPAAFGVLQRVAADIEYSSNETNYTLGLATLASGLKRRSLIIVFTEFTDTVAAELMMSALAPLLGKHLILFVVLRDAELDAFTAAEPSEPDDLSRAVTAAGLLRERRLVLTKLRHLGVEVVEAPAAQAGPSVVKAYMDLKRRGRI